MTGPVGIHSKVCMENIVVLGFSSFGTDAVSNRSIELCLSILQR